MKQESLAIIKMVMANEGVDETTQVGVLNLLERKAAVEDELWSPDKTCKYLGISKPTLHRYVEEGKLTPVRLSVRKHRYHRSAVGGLR